MNNSSQKGDYNTHNLTTMVNFDTSVSMHDGDHDGMVRISESCAATDSWSKWSSNGCQWKDSNVPRLCMHNLEICSWRPKVNYTISSKHVQKSPSPILISWRHTLSDVKVKEEDLDLVINWVTCMIACGMWGHMYHNLWNAGHCGEWHVHNIVIVSMTYMCTTTIWIHVYSWDLLVSLHSCVVKGYTKTITTALWITVNSTPMMMKYHHTEFSTQQ